MATAEATAMKLKVAEAMPKDLGRGLAPARPGRHGPAGAERRRHRRRSRASGRPSVKAMPAYKEHRGQSRVQIDGVTRENAGAAIDQIGRGRAGPTPRPAERVVLEPTGHPPGERDLKYIGSLFDGLPVVAGDRVRAALFGNRSADFKVVRPRRPARS